MIQLKKEPFVRLADGTFVRACDYCADIETARSHTMAWKILEAHNEGPDMENLHLKFDMLVSPEKLTLLTQFAEQIERTDKNHLMEAFMTVNLEAQEKGLQFNDQETALLVSILSSNMSPKDRKRLELLKMIAKKMAGPR